MSGTISAQSLWNDALSHLSTPAGLCRAALAISMHALDDVRPEQVEGQLQAIADRVIERCPKQDLRARVAHLHEVFFSDFEFRGDEDTYYNPLNSYLSAVLLRRRGNPITLTLLFKAVADRVGVNVIGLNTPGHFLAKVFDGDGWLILDPFAGGRILNPPEALRRISDCIGHEIPAWYLEQETSHAAWLTRMLRNLQFFFAVHRRYADLASIQAFQSSLDQSAQ